MFEDVPLTGLSFANFRPDFITWVVEGGKQHITFVDPKGIRNLPAGDDKIKFCKTIKEIEARLADPDITLSSFIVSNTPSHVMEKQWGMKKAEILLRLRAKGLCGGGVGRRDRNPSCRPSDDGHHVFEIMAGDWGAKTTVG